MIRQQVILTRDITARDLAMDAPEGEEGYPPAHVIGPAGSTVTLLTVENDCAEVTGFQNDPFAAGFVERSDIKPKPLDLSGETEERKYVIPGTKMFALLTNQGTAMSEAALCQEHNMTQAQADLIAEAPGGLEDWDGNPEFRDVTGNTEVCCHECGLWGNG